MSYKPQTQIDIENSPRYAVQHWRNIPEEDTNALESFLFWLEYDCEEDVSKEDMKKIKDLVNQYLGLDMDKIKAGENELLAQWIKGCVK